jgi:hypothetical protein
MLELIATIILVWTVCAGLVYPTVLNKVCVKCPYSRHGGYGRNKEGEYVYVDCKYHHRQEAIIFSFGGPFVLPFLISSTVGNLLSPSIRQESKRANEILRAEHQVELARIKAKETELLDKEYQLMKGQ